MITTLQTALCSHPFTLHRTLSSSNLLSSEFKMTLADIVKHNDPKFLHIHYSFDGCNNSDHGYIM
jgi:hypothetical protein